MHLGLRPDFGSPVMLMFGVLCTWIVLFFPFALVCRQVARRDALNGIESYLLGQVCGPLGIWLVLRANRKAAHEQFRKKLHAETAHEQRAFGSPEKIKRINHEEGLPRVDEMPGGRAFRPPSKPGHLPPRKTVQMDSVSLPEEVPRPDNGAPEDD